jgi:hypothetical protein
MGQRLQLQTDLETILGSRNVYFQPPENLQMSYPCVVYYSDVMDTDYADNNPYRLHKPYLLTVISRNPEEPAVDAIAKLRLCRHKRAYMAENLHHNAFLIYY